MVFIRVVSVPVVGSVTAIDCRRKSPEAIRVSGVQATPGLPASGPVLVRTSVPEDRYLNALIHTTCVTTMLQASPAHLAILQEQRA